MVRLMIIGIVVGVVVSLIILVIKLLLNSGKANSNFPQYQPHQMVSYEMPYGNFSNNVPMYINKNNQQSGPFPPEQILQMLNSGQVSPFDMAVRQGETQRQPLNSYFAARQI